ncbi:MAG: hypothetical protein ACTHQQ_23385 [Solirubrobacteraceae bacterium]
MIATRAFTTPTALWLSFAGGIALLALSLRALALHEMTVERVVHQLEVDRSGETFAAIRGRGIEITGTMRSWLHWLGHTGIGLAGAFIVVSTFIWPNATAQVSPRWLAFGVAAVAATIALGLLVDGLVHIRREHLTGPRTVETLLTVAAVAVAGALIVLTAAHGIGNLRWWTFGLGAGLTASHWRPRLRTSSRASASTTSLRSHTPQLPSRPSPAAKANSRRKGWPAVTPLDRVARTREPADQPTERPEHEHEPAHLPHPTRRSDRRPLAA